MGAAPTEAPLVFNPPGLVLAKGQQGGGSIEPGFSIVGIDLHTTVIVFQGLIQLPHILKCFGDIIQGHQVVGDSDEDLAVSGQGLLIAIHAVQQISKIDCGLRFFRIQSERFLICPKRVIQASRVLTGISQASISN